ncbi:hypothetical protein KY346_00010 [Candidatus Woesearchaeota archaeon]|nr:hypothetical protein [Candidatus Woesearchaeota archaeon]
MVEVYTINEEIVRQTLEVKFSVNSKTKEEWFISFSNPTAGPWKKIMFITKDGKTVRIGGYEKEEKRPDLIVFSRTHKLLFIIEAKDYLPELLKNHDKIEETFAKEYDKLSHLPFIKEELSTLFCVNGLVFFSDNIEKDYEKIKRKYKKTDNLLVFFVVKEGENLIIKIKTEITDKNLAPLKKIIPF